MKTKEQIEEMARKIYPSVVNPLKRLDLESAYIAGYEQAQRDFQERDAKLVEVLKFYAINGGSLWSDAGGLRARELLKELGYD